MNRARRVTLGGGMAFTRWGVALAAAALAGCASTTSSMRAATVLSRSGPLPVTEAFAVQTDRQVLFVSGSAWTPEPDAVIEMHVLIDEALVTTMRFFSNGPDTHRAFPSRAVPLSLAPGRHVLELRPGSAHTFSDSYDQLEAVLLED